MKRLTKRDVERLLSTFDSDPVGALSVALRVVLGRPHDEFDALIALADFSDDRRRRLGQRRAEALDELAAELNERRTL